MKAVFGDVKFLKASEKSALEKLAAKRSHPNEVVSPELLKRAAQIVNRIQQQVGLLIGRDGRVTHVVLGAKDRIYLPDLGRYRLDQARLRRLRLVVLIPEKQAQLKAHEKKLFLADRSKKKISSIPVSHNRDTVRSPEIAEDLLTDLEKLRFDSLLVVSVKSDGSAGAVSLAYLDPVLQPKHQLAAKASRQGVPRGISYLNFRDIYAVDLDYEQFLVDLEERFAEIRDDNFDASKDQAILVGAYEGSSKEAEASMDELKELARTAGIQPLDIVTQRRRQLDPRTVLGKGKIEDLVLRALDLGADLLIFDRELTPTQLRSISNLTELRVIDRSMLILDIFAQRAVSSEGRLQVEYAQLKYSLPRLSGKHTGLSRLTGGIGGRGPGETKLEIERRRVRDRIVLLEKKIEKVADRRELRRQRRQGRGVPVIAIVGYTNAGKSTLLNALTKGDVFVEGKLFATLDPSSRRMRFPNEREVVFVDTVGFIRELPKELVNAFRATLEEVNEADFLIHLVDASNPEFPKQIEVVRDTLESLGYGNKPRQLVLNKIDLLSEVEVQSLVRTQEGLPISAQKRIGLEALVQAMQDALLGSFEGQDPGRFAEIQQY